MKTTVLRLRISALSVLLMLASTTSLAQDQAQTIVAKIEQALGPKNVKAVYAFTNHRLDGTTSQYEVRFSLRNADKSHVAFVKPEREKGREILRLDDDIWSYAPSVGRVVRIADRDSFAGGDFSNADILRVDWLANYDVKIIKELNKQWIIEFQAKSKKAAYEKMRLWVDKLSGQPVQQQYYDSMGTMLKKCLYGDTKTFGSITRPSRLVMENVITKQKSELVVLEMQKVDAFPDSRFVVDSLGK